MGTDKISDAFTAVMFEVKVFWVVTAYSAVAGYQRFGKPTCFHLQGKVTSETWYHATTLYTASQHGTTRLGRMFGVQ
jgi:hypothetical protein